MSVVSTMERKVSRIGNSLGITLPSEFLRKIGVKQGDELSLELRDGAIVLRKSRKVELPKGISPDFFDVLNDTISQYNKTFEGLKDK